jgi:hypothetical protein
MKRDMDLIRKIMLEIEQNADPMAWVKIDIPDHSATEVSYHIKLLYEQGLVEANDCSDLGGISWKAKNLTYEGHDFLDAARSDTVWNKAKRECHPDDRNVDARRAKTGAADDY